jgi:hypothetical protein
MEIAQTTDHTKGEIKEYANRYPHLSGRYESANEKTRPVEATVMSNDVPTIGKLQGFDMLPNELKLQIWEEVIPQGQIIPVFFESPKYDEAKSSDNDKDLFKVRAQTKYQANALLSLCHSSRETMKRSYTLFEVGQLPFKTPFYFNPSRDTIYFESIALLRRFSTQNEDEEANRPEYTIKKLAIHLRCAYPRRRPHPRINYTEYFIGLAQRFFEWIFAFKAVEEVTFVVPDFEDQTWDIRVFRAIISWYVFDAAFNQVRFEQRMQGLSVGTVVKPRPLPNFSYEPESQFLSRM